jgi:very-short-patch-repair endonuclease
MRPGVTAAAATRARRKAMRERWENLLAAHLKLKGITGWEREHQFAQHIGRRWRFDFAFEDLHLAVEVEGGEWVQGRHQRPAGFREDCDKYNAATESGWRVLRYVPSQIRTGEAANQIQRIVDNATRSMAASS